ncbi:MAG: carboxypeptidase-like regulatory domain-containing protein [Bacteroidota bacterium]|nr:carboxypeptidase-like regulatory domain-containing protein [Bacteroidota bacterium]
MLLFSSSASAFVDTVETYPNGVISDYWSYIPYSYSPCVGTVEFTSDPRGIDNKVLHFHTTSQRYFNGNMIINNGNASLTSKYPLSQGYISFILIQGSNNYFDARTLDSQFDSPEGGIVVRLFKENTTTELVKFRILNSYNNSKYEVLRTSDTNYSLYENGSMVQSLVSSDPLYFDDVTLQLSLIGQPFTTGSSSFLTCDAYIDDITDYSALGTKQYFTETQLKVPVTWSAQLMRMYPGTYTLNIYSLSNTNNGGLIKSYSLPDGDLTDSLEHGYIEFDRSALLGSNFGLYIAQLRKDNVILAEQYFYMDQASNPGGFPDLLFTATSSVKSDIKDENNNGGEIDGGETVYLMPDIKESGIYNVTCGILETPYAIKTEFANAFNSSVNGFNVHYSGLSSQMYSISVDGENIGSTNGADTWDYSFSSFSNSHTISFAPDYTKPGVWGEVRDSDTQEGIKSATVSVTGENFAKSLYTDDNGLYYLTTGMEANKTYTITVSKTGYSEAPSQTATTVNGATTRQDFYLDQIATITSGSGLYYAPHDVAFTVLEYWYSGAGLTGVPYSISANGTVIKTGSTDSKGMFTGADMQAGTNYTITLTHNGTTYTEYVEPALSEYTYVLNKQGILHEYYNSWLNLSYTENNGSIAIAYASNKTLSAAAVTVTAANGTNVISESKGDPSGSFNFNLSSGDYTIKFNIEAVDGSTASQFWTLSSPPAVTLFPDSYPTWLKNLLYVGIIMIFLLAFGKSKNDVACGSAAVLVSLGYYFKWLSCGFNFVVLIWIIALGAIYLHYKRTGALG